MSEADLDNFNSGLRAVIDAYQEKCGAMNVRVLPMACPWLAAVLQFCSGACAAVQGPGS